MSLMRRTPGVSIRDAAPRAATERYLARNPGVSYLSIDRERVVGCALCGHDGRRGYLQHVIVDEAYRGNGVANRMVERRLAALRETGIEKTHIDVLVDNASANRYWIRRGWQQRSDIHRYSMNRSGSENA